MIRSTNQHSARTPGLLGRLLARARRKPKVRRLYLEVTHRCNLACPSCYTDAGTEMPDAMTLDQQKAVVGEAREMGARTVSISGSGEPLLYPHLIELIDTIRAADMDVVIFTNATACTADMAHDLLGRDVVVYVSLPSLDPEVVDRMTATAGAHRWVEYAYHDDGDAVTTTIPQGLSHLLDHRDAANVSDPVRLETLMTRINHTSLPRIAAFSRAMRLPLHLEVPVFTGRAIANYDQLALTAEHYRRLHAQLEGILGGDWLEAHRLHRCPVERNPVVRTNGDVGLCSSRGGPVGNVRDTALRDLFAAAIRRKRAEDRAVGRCTPGRYFHACRARRFYEHKHGLPHAY